MKNPIHKQTYRGRGIYWHGGRDYGDETQVLCTSMAAARARIDALLAAEADRASPADKYWATLTAAQREHWRRAVWDTAVNPDDLTAAELAYNKGQS